MVIDMSAPGAQLICIRSPYDPTPDALIEPEAPQHVVNHQAAGAVRSLQAGEVAVASIEVCSPAGALETDIAADMS
jgi:hypothetical protein